LQRIVQRYGRVLGLTMLELQAALAPVQPTASAPPQ
jgi:hypothetical protein